MRRSGRKSPARRRNLLPSVSSPRSKRLSSQSVIFLWRPPRENISRRACGSRFTVPMPSITACSRTPWSSSVFCTARGILPRSPSGAGSRVRTRRRWALLAAFGWIERYQIDIPPIHSGSRPAAGASTPLAVLRGLGLGIVGGSKQLSERVARSGLRLDHQAPVIDRQADLCARDQVQNIEQRRGDSKHDRAADRAQISRVHETNLRGYIMISPTHCRSATPDQETGPNILTSG